MLTSSRQPSHLGGALQRNSSLAVHVQGKLVTCSFALHMTKDLVVAYGPNACS